MMKLRVCAVCILVSFAVALWGFDAVSASAEELFIAVENPYEIYLGDSAERSSRESGVWQTNEAVNRGDSVVRYGLERGGSVTENTFLRMANFDGVAGNKSTSVALSYAEPTGGAVVIGFDYRLREGEAAYTDDAVVFTLYFRGATKSVRFGELKYIENENFAWRHSELTFTPQAVTSDYLLITAYMPSSDKYSVTGSFADIDNVSVAGADVQDFEFAKSVAASELAYRAPTRNYSSYMLEGDDISLYDENTRLSDSVSLSFDNGQYSTPLAKQGSSGTYRGATSVSAGESDIYAVYDSYQQNTFLRLSNFNGSSGVTSSRFVMYFYNNATGDMENMPVTERIFLSFRYRLFIDDYILAGMNGGDTVFNFSTRSSAVNHDGEIALEELTVNEPGDDSWHEYSRVVNVQMSATANFTFFYYNYADPSFSSTTFCDIDGMRVSDKADGKNYAHLDGEFEGLALADGAKGAETFYRAELGGAASKVALDSLNYAMSLGRGETFSVRTDIKHTTGVIYAAFDVRGQAGDKLDLYLSGRGGQKISLEVGKNVTGGTLNVLWTNGETKRCILYFASAAYYDVTSVDFVNVGTNALLIDNLRVGQVQSVSDTPGDYAAFTAALDALKAEYGEINAELRARSRTAVKQAIILAQSITARSSQTRMDEAISRVRSALDGAERLADMTEINRAIAAAAEVLAERSGEEYTKTSWLTFTNSLTKAKLVTSENTQAEVDAAALELNNSMSGLVLLPAEEGKGNVALAVSLGVSGGLTLLGVGAIILKGKRAV